METTEMNKRAALDNTSSGSGGLTGGLTGQSSRPPLAGGGGDFLQRPQTPSTAVLNHAQPPAQSAATQPASQTPAAGQENPFSSLFSGPTGVMNFLRSPTGFGMLASAFRPVTRAVLGYGGLPGLFSLYGLFTGNQNYQRATSTTGTDLPQYPEAPAQPTYQLPQPQQGGRVVSASVARLLLPVQTRDGRLEAPLIVKRAAEKPTNPPLPAPAPAPVATPPPPQEFVHPLYGPIPGGGGLGGFGFTHTPTPAQASAQTSDQLRNLAATTVGHTAATSGLQRLITRQALQRGALQTAGSTARVTPGVGTAVSGALDLADAAGIRTPFSLEPDRPSFFSVPRRDRRGIPQIDQRTGQLSYQLGWNPSAFGWNTHAFDQATTPNGYIVGNFRTGNPWIDHQASGVTSAMQAAMYPAQSAYAVGRAGAEAVQGAGNWFDHLMTRPLPPSVPRPNFEFNYYPHGG
jgi:hypothetical protein